MADSEFEEFRHVFERLPQHIKAPAQSYTLVHDVFLDEDSPTSPKSEPCGDEDSLASLASLGSFGVINNNPCTPPPPLPPPLPLQPLASTSSFGAAAPADTVDTTDNNNSTGNATASVASTSSGSGGGGGGGGGSDGGGVDSGPESLSTAASTPPPPPPWVADIRPASERRPRRRLPEIPKYKKPVGTRTLSLADELGEALERSDSPQPPVQFAIGGQTRPLLVLKCHSYLRDEDSSPDSERFHSTDVDSGNSTAHSPDGPKSTSPPPALLGRSPSPASPASSASGSGRSSGGTPFPQLELLEATHRGLHKFIPRHIDEIEVEIGDPIYVQKEADDLWCEGVNLRSGLQGIFPSAYAVDVDYSDFDPSTPKVKRERYLLGYLGSVETRCHKGNSVLCQAVRKIVGAGGGAGGTTPSLRPHACILEVSDQGLRMVDRRKPAPKDVPCHDYFYSLKNVSFCAFHPRDHRYMGFITKHPQLQRFACHVFVGQESTRPVAEAVGRAFQRFYTKFIETAYPIEDIYIE